ncbi:MAG: SagB/ThcOx family dehydrogenase [Bacteroidales bacterium]|nr:SagB/ThcOx family dehydrogenase [Bacteroidales bacterium]
MKTILLTLTLSIISISIINAQDIQFPQPDRDGGMPLMKALNLRKTSREFSPRDLTVELMGNLFWAACGTTRGTYRTVPSAVNWQEVRAYAVTKEGIYLYHDRGHYLEKLIDGDFREYTGTQSFVKDAPLTIVLVADYSRMRREMTEEDRLKYSWADAAYISQNIYLFCASENLNTGVRALIDRDLLREKMQLPDTHRIVLAQCVSYPVE